MVKFIAIKNGYFFSKETQHFNHAHGNDGEEHESAVEAAIDANIPSSSGGKTGNHANVEGAGTSNDAKKN